MTQFPGSDAVFEGYELVRNLNWFGTCISINRRYIIGRRGNKHVLILSREYRGFITSMVQAFFQDKELALNEPLAVRIIISLGKNRRINDVDAFTKQILDALEESHIVTNDALVEKVLAERIRGQNKTTIDHLEISIYTRQKL